MGDSFYISPEMALNRPHGKASDVWSAGVLLHVLLSGTQPFLGTGESLRYTICSGELNVRDRKFILNAFEGPKFNIGSLASPAVLLLSSSRPTYARATHSSTHRFGAPSANTPKIYCNSCCASIPTTASPFTKPWNTGGSRLVRRCALPEFISHVHPH